MSSETPNPAPVENKPETAAQEPQKSLQIKRKAILVWREVENGEIKETEESYRSSHALLQHLFKKLDPKSPMCKWWLEIYLQVEPEEGKDIESAAKIYLYKGEAIGAITSFMERTLPPRIVLAELKLVADKLMEFSSLKGLIISAVCEDAQAGGIGVLSEASEVTHDDIKVLGEAAAAQAELYKDNMRKAHGITFPGDSDIIAATHIPNTLKFSLKK